MAWDEEEDNTIYQVVVNHEDQYSIWPDYKPIPNGWRAVGRSGKKEECLAYIKEVWTDMRPLSLRKWMEEAERKGKYSRKPQAYKTCISSDAELLAELKRFGGTPSELLQDCERMRLMSPTVRSDLTVCETYAYPAPFRWNAPSQPLVACRRSV
jgi:MbtH protein